MGGHASGLFQGTSGARLPEKLAAEAPSSSLPEDTMSDANYPKPSTSVDEIRNRLLSEATTSQVREIVRQVYRQGATVGDGGCADAIREQIRTGTLVGGRDHIRKGRERLRQIEKILSRMPDHPDRELLERLRDDLRDALGGV